jgi:hypothetical protein
VAVKRKANPTHHPFIHQAGRFHAIALRVYHETPQITELPVTFPRFSSPPFTPAH